jgi:hypothetical protein
MTNFEKFIQGKPFWANDKSKQLFYCSKNEVIGTFTQNDWSIFSTKDIPHINGFIWHVSGILKKRFAHIYQGNICKSVLIDIEELEFVES